MSEIWQWSRYIFLLFVIIFDHIFYHFNWIVELIQFVLSLFLQVSRLLCYPCRYHPMGCKQSFPLSQKAAHERDCAFLQLKCPFHGQCVFNGSLADVVPHLAAEHAVTPVPVQPAGTLFYRAKNFYRRNIWTLIYSWDKPSNLFRFIVKHVHATQVGRTDNCNLLIAHIQYIGPESMASRYVFDIYYLYYY